ncbi:hypothetical protein C8F04DRAFT_1198004 [Mycena alexandri]|uniref:Uncharacterized protein n=1 Tax=Mycena alexandri TaxID=1745969 RepID=A0AAD6S589_9AGAR|nr:hypothetical protein C8F04DRAFT_1198004 [Mycena alexandri]
MHPKICLALNDCPIDWKHIVLREISSWVNLCQEPPHKTYFYHRCLTGKPKGKDGVATFKKPTKAFELALVIGAEQCEETWLTHISSWMLRCRLLRLRLIAPAVGHCPRPLVAVPPSSAIHIVHLPGPPRC